MAQRPALEFLILGICGVMAGIGRNYGVSHPQGGTLLIAILACVAYYVGKIVGARRRRETF